MPLLFTELWHLKRSEPHLENLWFQRVASNQLSRNRIFNTIRFIHTNGFTPAFYSRLRLLQASLVNVNSAPSLLHHRAHLVHSSFKLLNERMFAEVLQEDAKVLQEDNLLPYISPVHPCRF
ncbi:hypothetical protein AVEN_196735-1 [Araneus ventricosus]|uniref:Uncharacterized protein n=1 Tax=Araneus ventricosus TaxID=182803 RepID=A0A4Y2HAG1_ARAVE|nr:hypothetical protein AVEN_196735-1 [Araneus ventricosus]